MFKVLIVDDEIFVLTLIEKIIDWDKLNMTIIGKAYDGLIALELVEELKPDIVILDVRMPGYDGITLMQKVREINTKIKFIVVSGHKSFEYAKSAIKYNVEDYILKPISKKELESILLKLKIKLEKEEENENAIQEIDNQLGVSTSKVRSQFLEQVFKHELNFCNITIEKINSTYYTHFQDNIYLIAILKFDTDYKRVDKGFLSDLLNTIADKFSGEIQSYCSEILYEVINYKIILFLNYDYENKEKLSNTLKDAFVQREKELLKFNNIYITLCLGDDVKEIGNIYSSLRKAETIMKSRISLGINKIIDNSKLQDDIDVIKIIMSDKRCEEILAAIESLNIDRIKRNVLDAFQAADEYKYKVSMIYYQLCDEIHKIFFNYISKLELYKGSYNELKQKLYNELEWCCTERELTSALLNHISEFLEQYVVQSDSNENPVIRISKHYIVENYKNTITLASIAKIVNVSPVYFSILFKKVVGINFVDYLNQFRVGVAKNILRDVKHNVNEAASLSGYQDSRYFSKIFKKTTGITPTDYRNRHIR